MTSMMAARTMGCRVMMSSWNASYWHSGTMIRRNTVKRCVEVRGKRLYLQRTEVKKFKSCVTVPRSGLSTGCQRRIEVTGTESLDSVCQTLHKCSSTQELLDQVSAMYPMTSDQVTFALKCLVDRRYTGWYCF